MKVSQGLTYVVIFGTVGLLIVYDVWAAYANVGATISERMLDLGHRHPIILFAMGCLMGHFWASQAAEAQWQAGAFSGGLPVERPRTPRLLLWLGLGLLVLGVLLEVVR
jgi:hypothetical protein